jgi:hypothetical protein
MDTIIIGIYGKHHHYFTQNEITVKEKSTKLVILIPGFRVKIWTMIGCSNKLINDNPVTAPSKRIQRFFPGYRKGSSVNAHAYRIAQRIGLERIRRQCPHLANIYLAPSFSSFYNTRRVAAEP